MANVYGGQGVSPTLRGQPTNVWELAAGSVMLIPSGTWKLALGRYLKAQEFDSISTMWRDIGDDGAGDVYLQSDGANHRVANQTGCAVGAFINVGGSGYTSPPTVVPSAGGSQWQAIVGGAVNTSVSITNGGSNYLYPPIVAFAAPPSPGLQATGYATISGGVVTGITVTDQGAGYTAPPPVYLYNDPRDTAGAGATAACVLTGAGQVTGLVCTDHGNPLTAVPTLTFSGGGGTGAAAIVLMDWTVTSVVITGIGGGYSGATAGYAEVRALFGAYASTTTFTNPQTQLGLVRYRPSKIFLPTTAAGAFTLGTVTSALNIVDGGIYAGPPLGYAILGNGIPTTNATMSFTMGGVADSFRMYAV
jgi:hypothetical protein